ncbi:MAG: glycosyl transferase [Natronospirillum sp.]|uniref:GH36-type glycosyl hydrolase domain-containing protein n=1 Tax=Natronospirillum sp. TaxID=2812955 RepID=UPI0025F50DA1|nr:glucoamylase family protein [Natronospirillum sp.]MCH8553149.1 glycosyl transferase [Natronospirillum sp.]
MVPNRKQSIRIKAFELSSRSHHALRYDRDTELLRSALFSTEQMTRHAVTLAQQHQIGTAPGPDQLLPRLDDNARVLQAAYDVVTSTAASGQQIIAAESWLLDNYYMIEQQITLVRRHLPRGFSRQLPRLSNGLSTGLPRIYDLALQLISHMDGRVDKDNTTRFIASYQTVEPLKLGELWAFPNMLQLALLENLRRVGLHIAQRRQEKDSAIHWADRMIAMAESDPRQVIQLLAEFAHADVPLTAPFIEEFFDRLKAQGPAMAFVQTWVEQQLADQGVTAARLSEADSRLAAENQLSIANSIGSLRFIDGMDWALCVESLSLVEKVLRNDPYCEAVIGARPDQRKPAEPDDQLPPHEDPASLGDQRQPEGYGQQDFATRDRYRHIVEDISRRSDCSEWTVALKAIALAKLGATQMGNHDRRAHVGYYLMDHGRPMLEQDVGFRPSLTSRLSRLGQQLSLPLYLAPIGLFTALFAMLVVWALWEVDPTGFNQSGLMNGDWRLWLLIIPLLVVVSKLAISLTNRVVTLTLPPRALPRLDFQSTGIPEQHRTMVVVPSLLGKPEDVDDLLEAMEIRYLGNRDSNLFFALLTDFPDADEQALAEDEAILAAMHAGLAALNRTYHADRPCIFFWLHRPRLWNPIERIWMGYERKRGKLAQFNARLRKDDDTAFSETAGDQRLLRTIQYVITLDTDTQLPRDTACALIGNLAHPLNRPVYDPHRGRIVEGHAVLQPGVAISLLSAGRSRFSKLHTGDSGIDPYTREVSDVYQDVFGEGSFVGKGIYDVNAFRQAIDERFPENLILSHDLLEGGYARSALVTDVLLVEDHPSTMPIDTSRRHRWIRGDWQLLGWLLPRVQGADKKERVKNPLSALSRWKLLDNLRRSLIAPSLLALLVGGWLSGLGETWFWTLIAVTALILPPIMGRLIELLRKSPEREWLTHIRSVVGSSDTPLIMALLELAFLPYDAVINLSAILRSSGRRLFTRRGLLLWQLPDYKRRNAQHTIFGFYQEMWFAPALALGLSASLAVMSPATTWYPVAPLLLLWLISPLIAWWISQPLLAPTAGLGKDQQAFLRLSARRTWRYFADFVGPEDNWLPPDNIQEHPFRTIASRTSPTNMGLSLLADLAACDFGYITVAECLERLDKTLASMDKLERYRGHFYNWYDTRTLQILPPHYISSVDSGNLAGSLLTLQAGLLEMKAQPVFSPTAFEGLQDTLQVFVKLLPSGLNAALADNIRTLQDNIRYQAHCDVPWTLESALAAIDHIYHLRRGLFDALASFGSRADQQTDERQYWAQAFDHQLRTLHEELKTLHEEPATCLPEMRARQALPLRMELKCSEGLRQCNLIDQLVLKCRDLATMNFDFLYDSARSLLAIGYDVGERRRDPAHYDLLASEARLASFLLIAQGQVPQKHWFSLGRLLTSRGGNVSLISWSGSMFEYLMPQLIMPSFADTLLQQSCKAAVERQIEYGRQRQVPWGISESCYNATDLHQVYQYRAFGVPGLGFKRGLGDDLVIAPYASALALMVKPGEACRNLQSMAEQGFLGAYGFYEAIDYTPSRVVRNEARAIVKSFMVHHQGMSFLAFAQVLLDQPMQRRFMSDPQARATELLLQERVPKRGATLHPHAAEVSATARPPNADDADIMRVLANPNTPAPEVHLLSNGRYHVMATHTGGSTSRWRDLTLTRWREDTTADNWGTFVYLRDSDSGKYWSATYQPTLRQADHYEAIFVQARAEYRRRDKAIETHTELSVSPEDDVEIRRITLTNQSSRRRRIEVTSYAEVVLANLNADLAHRAFSNLFVQTEILPDRGAILCTRRARTPGEQVPWMFHLLAAPEAEAGATTYETDRSAFVGRGRTAANPIALARTRDRSAVEPSYANNALSNTQGSVLDPIVAIRRTLTLDPDETSGVQIITGIADTRDAALSLIEKYCDRHFVERAFEMAGLKSQDVLRHLNASEAEAQLYGRLASALIYSHAQRRASPERIARNSLGQSSLWRFGISGDLAIILLHIGDVSRIALVSQILKAHTYWRMKGLNADLVIVNEDFSGYRADLHQQIMGLISAGPGAQLIDKPGGVFLRRAEELTKEEWVLLQAVARIVLSDSGKSLAEQVERRVTPERYPDWLEPEFPRLDEPAESLPSRNLVFNNGRGGFTPDGREYVVLLEPGQTTPAPWVNVIASPQIGTVVSESGSAYTWAENAHEFRLTSWHNDPLSDQSGEAIYLRDEETGAYWSPTPLPTRGRTGYVCRHGFGYSVFEHQEAGIRSELSTYVAMDAPVKFVVLKLHNPSATTRQLSATGFWELVMGEWRHSTAMHIVTEADAHTGALFARNPYGRECADRIVFAHVNDRDRTVSGSRAEFIGRNGALAKPAAMRRTCLSGITGAGLDPCAALQTMVELPPGETREIVFTFGAAANADEARHLIQQYSGTASAHQALEAVWEYWKHTLGAVNVETPNTALNILANGWLVYQTISCRLWARSGNYQSGGAFGFRDQLQDTLALIHATPWLAREQLLRCAGRQFSEGDVQHWWHPPNGQGVRTRFSDDYLWLPYAACRYVLTTGDLGVLDEQVHFLEGRALYAGEEANYDQPSQSAETASIYEHCVRAIRYGLRFGAHHLPLMGCGDWNDGMNLVGKDGKGESVWLAWFLYDNLTSFAELAQQRGDGDFAATCRSQAAGLITHIEDQSWDGAWYKRAWFDDGTPLGSASNDECQIDSISQSWSILSGGGEPGRARQAMQSVNQRLVRRDHKIIQLLDPPFDTSSLEPGYIKGYIPGVRENGGQYTHAAVWATMAFARIGDTERAWELFDMLHPIAHGDTPKAIARYKVEPYVMCADIYGVAPHAGRGGWTWYTGAAGWMYQLTVETLLGLQREGDFLRLVPCIPADWGIYKIHYRYRDTVYHITVTQSVKDVAESHDGTIQPVTRVQVDNNECLDQRIPLVNDHQDHFVDVQLGEMCTQ